MHALRRARRGRSLSPSRGSRGRGRRAASPALPSTLDVDPATFARAVLADIPRATSPGFASRNTPAKLRSSARKAFPPPKADNAGAALSASDLGGVQRLVLRARSRGESLCAARVSLTALKTITLRAKRSEVLVQAGATLGDLRAAELAHGFCVCGGPRPNAERWGDGTPVSHAVLAGAFPSGAVQRLSFVDARGRLRVIAAASDANDGALFAAARVSLGLFGVLYDVAFVVDMRPPRVSVENLFPPVARFFDRKRPEAVLALRDIVESGPEEVEVTWTPFSSVRDGDRRWRPECDDVWVRVLRKTKETETTERSKRRFETLPQWLHSRAPALALAGYTAYAGPHARLLLAHAATSTHFAERARRTVEPLGDARVRYVTSDRVPVHVSQIALPLEDSAGWTGLHTAVCHVVKKVEKCDTQSEYPLNVGLRIRFVEGDDAFLSPTFASQEQGKAKVKYAIVSIATAEQTPGWTEFAADIFMEWMQIPGARLSWDCPPPVVDEAVIEWVRKSMGPALRRFWEIRRTTCVDDVGLFLPCSTVDVLGVLKSCMEPAPSPILKQTHCVASIQTGRHAKLAPLHLAHYEQTGLSSTFDKLISPVTSEGTLSPLEKESDNADHASEDAGSATVRRLSVSDVSTQGVKRVASWYGDARGKQNTGFWTDESEDEGEAMTDEEQDEWGWTTTASRDYLVALAYLTVYAAVVWKLLFGNELLS